MRNNIRQLRAYVAEAPRVYAVVVTGSMVVGCMELLGVSALIPMVAVFLGEPMPAMPSVVRGIVRGVDPRLLGALFVAFVLVQTAINTGVERYFVQQVGRWRTALSLDYIRSVLASDFSHHRSLNPGEMEVMITRNIGLAMKIRHRTALFLTDCVLAVFYVAIAMVVSAFTFFLFVAVGAIYATINRFTLRLRMEHSQTAKASYLACALHVSQFFSDTRSLLTYEKRSFIEKVSAELEASSKAQVSTDILNVFTRLIHQPVMLVLIMCAAAAAKLAMGLENSRILVMLYVFYRAAPKVIEVARGYGEIIGDSPEDVTQDIAKWRRRAQSAGGGRGVVPAKTDLRLRAARVRIGDQDILTGADLDVAENSFVLIAGESGSGKSTLLDVLCGFRALDAGELSIGGVHASDVDFEKFRIGEVALVRPESVIVTGNIAENIAYLLPGRREAMEEIFGLLKLDSFLGSRSGLDTLIDPRGANLSAGQRQRIVLARALYKRPRLLLLDEPTSNLDPVTEQDILRTLSAFKGRMTIVAVSHQKAVERLADAVFRIESGRLARV